MADHVLRISEEEAARNFASLMGRVRDGTEFVIEARAATCPRRYFAPPNHTSGCFPSPCG